MGTEPVEPNPRRDVGSDIAPVTTFFEKALKLDSYSPTTRKIGSLGLTFFLGGLIIATVWEFKYWALSVLWCSACMVVGWAVGFLFGVPHAAATDKSTNTNLEQISDWLTKVLVGVGLTQLQRVPAKLLALSAYIAKDYGPSGSNVFALSMFLYFIVLGFLIGYLLTRLALQADFGEKQFVVAAPEKLEIRQPRTHPGQELASRIPADAGAATLPDQP
jgi:hypothetical protein